MPAQERNPLRSRLRQLAWLLALLLAVAGWRLSLSPFGLLLRLAAAIIFTAGTLWPSLFSGAYRAIVAAFSPLVRLAGQCLGRPQWAASVQSFAFPAEAPRRRRRPRRLLRPRGSPSRR